MSYIYLRKKNLPYFGGGTTHVSQIDVQVTIGSAGLGISVLPIILLKWLYIFLSCFELLLKIVAEKLVLVRNI